MKTIRPNRLKRGDTVAIIAPARGYSLVSNNRLRIAKDFLKKIGLNVKLLGRSRGENELCSQKIKDRAHDINSAFRDDKIKGVISLIGGYNSIQLLELIDYKAIRNNPKVFCGYSDITTLSLAFYSQTGLLSYSGPHFSSWSIPKEVEYMQDGFIKCCFEEKPYEIGNSKFWFDGKWYSKDSRIKVVRNQGSLVINNGHAKGRLIGGHLRSINSLQGTKYFPNIKNSILFLEEDFETSPDLLSRNLTSLSLQKDFKSIKGVLMGRFQNSSGLSDSLLKNILLETLPKNIPIIINLDFGHTMPISTLPIGGELELDANKGIKECSIKVLKH